MGDDAMAEMQMAREGGAIGIAVTSGSTSAAEWAASRPKPPHMVIDSIGDLAGGLGLGNSGDDGPPQSLGFSASTNCSREARGAGR